MPSPTPQRKPNSTPPASSTSHTPASDTPGTTDRRLVRLLSGDFWGIDGRPVEVQVDVSSRSAPGFTIVGLPGKSTRESRDRIRAAILNSGFRFPHQDRILVNLAPAFQKKDGAVFDLPVALGILLTTGQVPNPWQGQGRTLPVGLLGELGLQGELRPVPGALLIGSALRSRGMERVVVPRSNAEEVALAPGLGVYPARDLHEAIHALRGELNLYRRPKKTGDVAGPPEAIPDFSEVRGQEATKRGLLVSAAGGHHVLLIGPPGVGKTLLAQRIPGILPPLDFEESLDVTRIYSVAGLLASRRFECQRPFRAPHHTISYAGLVGGGNPPRPGEISLAHQGVLFLDELPEFSRKVLETLRQPLESGRIVISRSGGSVLFPARFLVVGAMNPCPCGYAGYFQGRCRCSPGAIEKYRSRISGPLLDRIDILLEVAPPPAREILSLSTRSGRGPPLSTADLRCQVLGARRFQRSRWGEPISNGRVPHERMLRKGSVGEAARRRLEREAGRRGLSARALGRALRVARTLADLEEVPLVQECHVLEALALHRPDGLST